MNRVLAYTSPARGHLFPLTPILDQLRARGHEVSLRTLSSEVEQMRTRGFAAAPIDPAIEAIEHDDWGARGARAALRRAVATFCARAELDAPDLRRAIEQERPELLIVDIQCWGALAAAEAWGGPWAAFCPYPLPLPSRDAPPFGPGLPPARGPLGRLRDRLLRPLVFGTVERDVVGKLNGVRAGLGLGPVDATTMFTRPPLLLYMTAEPFEYPRSDWPPNLRLVGPCAWDPPAEPPEWLREVERPLVLVTTSSEFQDDGRLVRTALTALAGEDLEVVATLPAASLGEFAVPANARVLPFAPHAPLLERAACAITHGGMGATQKAIAAGVPVCAVPFGRDQLEVARRVEVAGAGSRLSVRRLSPERLRAKVHEAMAQRDGAEHLAAAFEATGGPAAAASAVEELARSPRKTPHAVVPHLHQRFPALAETLPHLVLSERPTPVRELTGLGIWVKEDGAFGAGGWGGNKVRKLEWLIPDAQRRGRRSILTFGGLGTNWGLATALYAREHGIATALALLDQPLDAHVEAQLARLEASGARIHRTHTKPRTVAMLPWLLARNARGGRPPYLLPAGGSSPVGALGYVEAALEIAAQVEAGALPEPSHVVVAVGTGGTAAGLALGFQLAGLRTRVVGIVVNDQLRLDAPVFARLARRSAKLLERRGAQLGPLELGPGMLDLTRDQLGAGYGHPTEAATAAAARAAKEGLALDPVYTAKAMAGLLALRAEGRLVGPLLFIHTDGPRQLAPKLAR